MWKETEWESVGFQLTDWFQKSKWITRFKTKNTDPAGWCKKSMDKDTYSTKDYDSQWETLASFWNAKENTLLLDFQRPMDVKGEQTINFNKFTEGDGSEESQQSVDFMLNYGVYKDSTATTSSRATTKREAGKTVPDKKATIGGVGDTNKSEYGKKGATNYRPEGY